MENIKNQPVAPLTEEKDEVAANGSGSPSLHLKKEVIRTLSGEELNLVGGGMAAACKAWPTSSH